VPGLDIIITSFPERWDRSNGNDLPLAVYERLTSQDNQGRGGEFKSLTALDTVTEIVKTCLEFEPFISNNGDGERSYLEAFGNEIAFVVSHQQLTSPAQECVLACLIP
jgi:hypothetical protein